MGNKQSSNSKYISQHAHFGKEKVLTKLHDTKNKSL